MENFHNKKNKILSILKGSLVNINIFFIFLLFLVMKSTFDYYEIEKDIYTHITYITFNLVSLFIFYITIYPFFYIVYYMKYIYYKKHIENKKIIFAYSLLFILVQYNLFLYLIDISLVNNFLKLEDYLFLIAGYTLGCFFGELKFNQEVEKKSYLTEKEVKFILSFLEKKNYF